MSVKGFVIKNGVLKKYKGLGGDVVIPEGVTEIHDFAFFRNPGIRFCYNLTEITIPSSVYHIEKRAFDECKKLTVRCEENSLAQAYAIRNNIPFGLIYI